jgi:uncharacterized protein YcnI
MLRRLLPLVALVLVMLARPAWAHVEVEPEEATRGATVDLSFHVPNEEDDASTTRVEIAFPTDHPIASARPQPVAGWEASVQMTGANVGSVTWTGGAIPPDGEQNFVVNVTLPGDGDRLVFKALQTYDNGEVVRWIEETPPGGEEPEHPAPVVTLTGPVIATTSTAAPATTVAATTTTAASGEADDDDAANVGLIVGIAAAVLAAVVGITAAVRSRRRSAS